MISLKQALVLSGAIVAFGVASAQVVAEQKADAGPMVLHVRRSEVRTMVQNIRESIVWGTIGTEKVELANYFGFQKSWVLKPGDYPVRLKKDATADGKVEREYEVEVAPGKKVDFFLIGMEE